MKMKKSFYLALILLIASFATVPQSIAQVPCGAAALGTASLVVNWPQYLYDPAHTGASVRIHSEPQRSRESYYEVAVWDEGKPRDYLAGAGKWRSLFWYRSRCRNWAA